MIRVGGATEVEVKERKDRVDDAMHATRAAVEEGIVAGGGVALLYADQGARRADPANNDQKVGIDIVRKALSVRRRGRSPRMPAPTARSWSASCSTGTTRTTATTRRRASTPTWSRPGIIDPTKVVRHALQDAASVAGLLITTEAMVAEKPEPKTPMPAMPPGGGMGGMDF